MVGRLGEPIQLPIAHLIAGQASRRAPPDEVGHLGAHRSRVRHADDVARAAREDREPRAQAVDGLDAGRLQNRHHRALEGASVIPETCACASL